MVHFSQMQNYLEKAHISPPRHPLRPSESGRNQRSSSESSGTLTPPTPPKTQGEKQWDKNNPKHERKEKGGEKLEKDGNGRDRAWRHARRRTFDGLGARGAWRAEPGAGGDPGGDGAEAEGVAAAVAAVAQQQLLVPLPGPHTSHRVPRRRAPRGAASTGSERRMTSEIERYLRGDGGGAARRALPPQLRRGGRRRRRRRRRRQRAAAHGGGGRKRRRVGRWRGGGEEEGGGGGLTRLARELRLLFSPLLLDGNMGDGRDDARLVNG